MKSDAMQLAERAQLVFGPTGDHPAMTLRAGDAVDSYEEPPAFDAAIDNTSDEYLEQYYFGLPHLDRDSWLYYLPVLIGYAARHKSSGESMVVDGLLTTLRPGYAKPDALPNMTKEQEDVIVELLELLAFSEDSWFKEEAMQVMEEYWIPGAPYRNKK